MAQTTQTRGKTIPISSGTYLSLADCFNWTATDAARHADCTVTFVSTGTCNLVGPVADAATAATNESTQGALLIANILHTFHNVDPTKYFMRSSGAAVSGFFIVKTGG